MCPTFLPKVHAATKLARQVRIPPPAPQASHFTGRGVRGTPRAQEGHPLPRRLTRPRRPLPLYGTFSTEDWALAVAKEAERHAAEVADGAAGGLDLCGCAGHRGQKTAGQVPAELGGQVQAATGKTLCGKALRVRPSVRPHAEMRAFGTLYIYTLP